MAKRDQWKHAGGRKERVKTLLLEVADSKRLWRVFEDFIAMAALELSCAADPGQRAAREGDLQKVRERFTAAEQDKLAEAFFHLMMVLGEEHHDFLGPMFMLLGLGDKHGGQFFTPYEVCATMALLNLADAATVIETDGFVSILDPCSGSGAMVIAAAEVLLDAGYPLAQHLHVTAQDLDITAVHMTYVQLALLGVPAVVIHGNSLTGETWSTWHTALHFKGRWRQRMAQRQEHRAADA